MSCNIPYRDENGNIPNMGPKEKEGQGCVGEVFFTPPTPDDELPEER